MRIFLNAIKIIRHPEERFRRTPGACLEGRKTSLHRQTEDTARSRSSGPFCGTRWSPREGADVISSDRYIAFLLSTLPKLAEKRLYSPRWPLPMRRFAVLDRALRELRTHPGIALEFGVYRGRSLRHAARQQRNRKFYGFDSFRGLPQDGRPDWQLDFATDAPRSIPANCRLIPGWFADTIPAFLREDSSRIAFVSTHCHVSTPARDAILTASNRELGLPQPPAEAAGIGPLAATFEGWSEQYRGMRPRAAPHLSSGAATAQGPS